MSNFKVGDKVRLVNKDDYPTCRAKIGDIGTIVRKEHIFDCCCLVDFNGYEQLFKSERLELVEEKSDYFKKDDIKPGYLVEHKNGLLRLVTFTNNNKPDKILVSDEGQWGYLHNYSDELTVDFNSGYDIVKIYGFTRWCYEALMCETDGRPLLWERKEEKVEEKKPEPKKLTVAEIEKELGYSVEIISEGAENE